MSVGGLLPCLGRHFLRPENGAESPRQIQSRHDLVCDQRLATARPESQGPVFVEIGGTHQSGLGTEGVRLLGVCITTAVIEREFMNVRQADQACTEPRGTHARGSMSVGGGDRERDRAPVCPCRLYQCLHTSELTSRLVGHFRPRRQAQG